MSVSNLIFLLNPFYKVFLANLGIPGPVWSKSDIKEVKEIGNISPVYIAALRDHVCEYNGKVYTSQSTAANWRIAKILLLGA